MMPDEFDRIMKRLEKMFNQGEELKGDVRLEYLDTLRFLDALLFEEAVRLVVETFRPYQAEPFPSLATIQDAVTLIRIEDKIYGDKGERELDYCQLCQNTGIYLADDGIARTCRCEKGRLKRASWAIDSGARKRQERIQEALDKLPPSKGPVRGLMEKNALGFWEPNAIEHERWMEAKREQIRRLEARDAEREKQAGRRPPRTIDREALRLTIAATKALVAARTREIEEEEDEIPI